MYLFNRLDSFAIELYDIQRINASSYFEILLI